MQQYHHYVYVPEKDIISLYEKFEGHPPFIIHNDCIHNWLHLALIHIHNRSFPFIKFLLDKGHHYIYENMKYNIKLRYSDAGHNKYEITPGHIYFLIEYEKCVLFETSLRKAFMHAVIVVA